MGKGESCVRMIASSGQVWYHCATMSREMDMTLQRVRLETLDAERQHLYRRAIWITLAGNVLLAVAKGTVAWLSDSSAVLSDAANSLSDVLYSLLLAVGLYLAQQPADESHPQGHSRFEPLVSLLITIAMGVAGIAALREGILRFLSGAAAIEPEWPTVALVGSALVKVVMFLLVGRIGRLAQSPAIRACARDNLSDVLTSAAALVGVWGSDLIYPLLDPAAGVVVALWIFRAMWGILSENLGYLTGRGASPELTEQIVSTASTVPGVLNVHQVIADHVGPQLRVDMHVDVDGEMGLDRAHAIADQVQARVEALPAVDLAFVHVEPAGVLPQADEEQVVVYQLRQLAEQMGIGVHDVWIYETKGKYYAEVHTETDAALSLREAHEVVSSLEDRARAEIPRLAEVTAHIEPQGGRLVQVHASGLEEASVADLVRQVAAAVLHTDSCHRVQVRRSSGGWYVSMHCTLPGELSLTDAHRISTQLEARLRAEIVGLERVVIHTEPSGG
jgi:cation diffusion facilitator family transporter